MLIDIFDSYSTWIGVFDEARDEPIACGRVISRDPHGKLEMQYYSELVSNLKQINSELNPKVFELNRSAILPDYRGTVAWLILLKAAFLYCHEQQHSALSSTAIEKVQIVHNSIGYAYVDDISFKYDPTEEKDAKVYYAAYPDETLRVIKNLDTLIDKKIKKDNGEVIANTLSARL